MYRMILLRLKWNITNRPLNCFFLVAVFCTGLRRTSPCCLRDVSYATNVSKCVWIKVSLLYLKFYACHAYISKLFSKSFPYFYSFVSASIRSLEIFSIFDITRGKRFERLPTKAKMRLRWIEFVSHFRISMMNTNYQAMATLLRAKLND